MTGRNWFAIIAAITCSITVACSSATEAERREFVLAFVQSVFDGTQFHGEYLAPGREEDTEEARSRMSGQFSIIGMDRFFFTSYEYYLEFNNGAYGVVYLSYQLGKPRALLVVHPAGESSGASPANH